MDEIVYKSDFVQYVPKIEDVCDTKNTNDTNDTKDTKDTDVNKKEEKPIRTNLLFKHNKTTNHYSIFNNNAKRMIFTINNIFLPFGVESYNGSDVLNIVINKDNNYHYNTLVILKGIDDEIRKLSSPAMCNPPIDLRNLEHYSFISKDEINKKNKKGDKVKKEVSYKVRTYLQRGLSIKHSFLIGEYDKRNLKGKKCDIVLGIGSLWFTDTKYGSTIYVSSIKVH